MQIRDNLIRSMEKGLISEISKSQLVDLSLKYYGIDKDGNFTSNVNEMAGYVCPYTGKKVSLTEIQIDHIIPVLYNG